MYAVAGGAKVKGGPSKDVAERFIRDSKGARKRRAKMIVDRAGGKG